MENQKTKLEIWEIVLEGFDTFPEVSISGVFCLIRKHGLITWGEWYYLHDVLSKWNKKGCPREGLMGKERKDFPKFMVNMLKEKNKKL